MIGTTIAPWQLFFQQSCIADKRLRFADLGWARLDTLIGAVAQSYFNLRAAQVQLELTQRTLASRQESYNLVKRRFDGGVASELDLNQSKSLLDTASAELAQLARAQAQAVNALVLLLGAPLPEDLPAPAPFGRDQLLASVPAGLPSDLLERRPDILAAENNLKSANANIGAARAAFFPSIRLTTDIGTASASFSDLFGAGTGVWSFMPQITVPIFQGGRNAQGLDLANVRKEMAVVSYERAIQTAFAEVDDALAARQWLSRQFQAQKRVSDGERERLRLAERRYANGVASYLELLDAQRSEFHAAQQLIDVKQRVLVTHVALCRALGGGWTPADGAS